MRNKLIKLIKKIILFNNLLNKNITEPKQQQLWKYGNNYGINCYLLTDICTNLNST